MLITGTTYDNDRLYKCYFHEESLAKPLTATQLLYRVLDMISMILHNLEIYESDCDLFIHWKIVLKLVRKWSPLATESVAANNSEDSGRTSASEKVYLLLKAKIL